MLGEEMNAKHLAFSALLLATAIQGFAALSPYVESLDRAEAIAIVTVTACEQTFDGSFIHSAATLTVVTPIEGVKKGESFKQSFGLPQQPGTWKNGAYSQKTTFASETSSFEIAERYLVLLTKKERGWVVIRESLIIDDKIGDGYFDSFAGSDDVSVSKAIELLKAHKKDTEPNKTPQANDRAAPGRF